ncbi:glycosyltransferase family 4 protein [Rhodopirellula sp. MGV]|uniref:glycosyltransferase family 4 protein n=1 Tax=Rhodopirellula sp. MGV TaxID=2023130 RepID=UPI00117BC144|nr:glycosyltransferase family 4 protein [Rhodopirellula sp. MGV]
MALKVVFFTHYYTPEGNAPASRTSEHVNRWVSDNTDVDVTVITCAPNVPDGKVYPGYKNRLWPQREVIDGVNVVRVWSFIRPNLGRVGLIVNYVSYLFSALFAYLFMVRRPSVIVATTPQFFCGVAGILAGKLKRRPVVLEVRDIWPESIVTVGALRRGLLIRTLERIERWMYRSADHVVTVGPGYRDNVLSKVDAHNRISTVTNGVDPDQFDPNRNGGEFADRYGLGDRFVCSYIGTVGRAHGLEIVVRAAERFRKTNRDDVVFLVVGGGATLEQLQQMIAERDLGDLVKTTGRLDKSAMPDALAASDACLVHLSKVDLFEHVIPSKIFETMAMERAIIMGVRGRARDIVLDAGSGLSLEPENDEQLFEILKEMTADPQKVDQMGRSGREFVTEYFNRDRLAADMLEIVRRTAAGETFCLPDRTWESAASPTQGDVAVSSSDAHC